MVEVKGRVPKIGQSWNPIQISFKDKHTTPVNILYVVRWRFQYMLGCFVQFFPWLFLQVQFAPFIEHFIIVKLLLTRINYDNCRWSEKRMSGSVWVCFGIYELDYSGNLRWNVMGRMQETNIKIFITSFSSNKQNFVYAQDNCTYSLIPFIKLVCHEQGLNRSSCHTTNWSDSIVTIIINTSPKSFRLD